MSTYSDNEIEIPNTNAPTQIPWDLATIGFGCILLLIVWYVIKLFIRMLKAAVKPILLLTICLVVLYTKQFSYNADYFDLILNSIGNTMLLFIKVFETALKVIGID